MNPEEKRKQDVTEDSKQLTSFEIYESVKDKMPEMARHDRIPVPNSSIYHCYGIEYVIKDKIKRVIEKWLKDHEVVYIHGAGALLLEIPKQKKLTYERPLIYGAKHLVDKMEELGYE